MKRTLIVLLFLASGTPVAAQTDDPRSLEATIVSEQTVACPDGASGCRALVLESDSDIPDAASFMVLIDPREDGSGLSRAFTPGQAVVVQTQVIEGERRFFVSDIVRRPALLWLFALFLATVIAVGGARALRPFAGMLASMAVLIGFMLPRILAGDPPLVITLIGSLLIMGITFVLSHGWNRKTLAALCGTAGSLLLTVLIGIAFVSLAHLTGTADEEMLFLLADYPALNTQGILLAGIIIGALGVLDDVTVSQASAVFELRNANPLLSAKSLYTRALRIGHDHIAAAINTLLLAYAGASLPLLLLLAGISSGESVFTFLNREVMAAEIVRTLVGSIGLLAAVPLTTFLAAVGAMRTPPEHEATARHSH